MVVNHVLFISMENAMRFVGRELLVQIDCDANCYSQCGNSKILIIR